MALISREKKWIFIMVPSTGCTATGEALIKKFGAEFIPKKTIFANSKPVLHKKHNSIKDLLDHGLISKSELRSYLVFATVRNPFDRIVTAYARIQGGWWDERIKKNEARLMDGSVPKERYESKKKNTAQKKKEIKELKTMDFDTWVKNWVGPSPDASWLFRIKHFVYENLNTKDYDAKIYPGIKDVPHVIRTEHLEEDLNALFKRTGRLAQDDWIEIPKFNVTPNKKPYQSYYSAASVEMIERKFGKILKKFDYSFES